MPEPVSYPVFKKVAELNMPRVQYANYTFGFLTSGQESERKAYVGGKMRLIDLEPQSSWSGRCDQTRHPPRVSV